MIVIIINIIINMTVIMQGRDMASQRLSSALSLVNLGGAGQGVRDSRWDSGLMNMFTMVTKHGRGRVGGFRGRSENLQKIHKFWVVQASLSQI